MTTRRSPADEAYAILADTFRSVGHPYPPAIAGETRARLADAGVLAEGWQKQGAADSRPYGFVEDDVPSAVVLVATRLWEAIAPQFDPNDVWTAAETTPLLRTFAQVLADNRDALAGQGAADDDTTRLRAENERLRADVAKWQQAFWAKQREFANETLRVSAALQVCNNPRRAGVGEGGLGYSMAQDDVRKAIENIALTQVSQPQPEPDPKPNRVQVMSEITDGLRCGVCEQRIQAGETTHYEPELGVMLHTGNCPTAVSRPEEGNQQ